MTAAHDGLAEFLAMAEWDGFDVAHNWCDGKGWVFFNPATADIWKYWQASRAALGSSKDCQHPECMSQGCFGHCMKAGERRNPMITDQQILDAMSTTEPRTAGEIAALIGLSPKSQLSHIRSRLLTLRDDGAVRKVDGGKPPRWLKSEAVP